MALTRKPRRIPVSEKREAGGGGGGGEREGEERRGENGYNDDI